MELVATDESTVVAKPFPGAIVVEDNQGNRTFPDPTRTNEGGGCEVVH